MKQFLLNSGSTIEEGRLAKGGSKLSPEYTAECAVAEMNPEDYEALGSPEKVMVSTPDGNRGWQSMLMPGRRSAPGTYSCPGHLGQCGGGPRDILHRLTSLQGLAVLVEATEEEVLSAEDLVHKLYWRGK